MSIIGEAALSAFFQSLFDSFRSSDFWNFATEHKVHDEIKKWEKMLIKIHLVLQDAEEKQIQNRLVKSWLSNLKHLAYDVDDVLDAFATECKLRMVKRQADQDASPSKLRKLIDTCFGSAGAVKFNFEMMSKIKEVTSRLEDIVETKSGLNLVEYVRGTSSKGWKRTPSACLQNEPVVYGRDYDKSKIIELLLRNEADDQKVGVIPIVGMGGVGKTTLTQLVYNDRVISEYFDVKGWVCVSDVFDIMRVTKGILESITKQNCDLKELNQVQVKLHNELAGKRFLLVLDDIWSDNYDDWHALRSPFMAGALGSKVIVTTRSISIAQMIGNVEYHDLKCISNDDCWLLFKRHAFENSSVAANQSLEIIGRKIVDTRCAGLPLAARTLGGVLRSRRRYDEWEKILNNRIWSMPNNILPVLRLSYYDLPSHLKRCFAYCSIFPKDYEFKEKELVLLWMAEGYIQKPGDSMEIEDLGSEYFHELVSRSIFQASITDKSRFVMHDLVNDLAREIAEEICLAMEDESIIGERLKWERVRHCSYIQGKYDGIKKFEPFVKMKCLRTFLPFSLGRNYNIFYLAETVPVDLLRNLSCLRVLSFKHYQITELPDSISDLKHLRYLDLSYTKIEALPQSTTLLHNLQTLLLKECSDLKKLPTDMDNFINLRHLNITGVNLIEGMPLKIEDLTALQTLPAFVLTNAVNITTLKRLNSLQGRLHISNLENVTDASDTRQVYLKGKKINSLWVTWSSCNDNRDETFHIDVIEGLQPHGNLEELVVRNYPGARFPSWLDYPILYNLVTLTLENCKNCTSLPQLGWLSSLKDLSIRGMPRVKRVDKEFYGKNCLNPFPALEMLCFENMDGWEEWNPCGVEFSSLRELCIGSCARLSEKLPSGLSSLEKLLIRRCPELVVSLQSLHKLSVLEIRGSKAVDCRYKVAWGSLNMLLLSDIPTISNLVHEGFMHGLKKFKELTICGIQMCFSWHSNYIRNLECMFENTPQIISLMVDDDKELVRQGLADSQIEILRLKGCYKVQKLPPWIRSLQFLRELHIDDCPSLTGFSDAGLPPSLKVIGINNCNALAPLLGLLISTSQCLEELEIKSCESLISLGRIHFPPTLESLSIEDCVNLERLQLDDPISGNLSRVELSTTLKHLCIIYCPKLKSIAERIDHNTSLETITIRSCLKLLCLPDGLHNLTNIREIEISHCSSLVSFPPGGLPTSCLKRLVIQFCEKLDSLPDNIHNLTSLQQFHLVGCPSIVSFPNEGFPTNLTTLEIWDMKICKPLFEWGLHKLTSLMHLIIRGGCADMVCFPQDEIGMMLPPSLTRLVIVDFPNLEFLSTNGFQNLTSLQYLDIWYGPKLSSFPENGLPASLLQLFVIECPLLKQRCQKGKGQEWSKILHIPCIGIR